MTEAVRLDALGARLADVMASDRRRLAAGLAAVEARRRAGLAFGRELEDLEDEVAASGLARARRDMLAPRPSYPLDLPILAAREEILAALSAHQVIVVGGATGSGKTTQLPKLCLEAGRGRAGLIGHTQPRRIAARSVAVSGRAQARSCFECLLA